MKNMMKRLALPIALGAIVAAVGFPAASALAEDALTAGTGTPLSTGPITLPARSPRQVDVSGSLACGIVGRGTIAAGTAQLLYTSGLNHSLALDWSVMADTNATGPGVGLTNVVTQQADRTHTVYWLRIQNYSKVSQAFEMRVCVLN